MDSALKRRLLVAIIIVALVVIFLPIPFGHLKRQEAPKPLTQIPPAPTQSIQPVKKLSTQQINAINQGFVPVKASTKSNKHARVAKVSNHHSAKHLPKKSVTKPSDQSPVVAEYATADSQHEKSILVTQSDLGQAAPKVTVRQSNLSSGNAASAAAHHQALKNRIKKARQMDQAWVAQLGSFKKPALTEDVVTKLRKNGYTAFSYQTKVGDTMFYRVYVGPYLHMKQAQAAAKAVKDKFRISGYVHQFDAANLN